MNVNANLAGAAGAPRPPALDAKPDDAKDNTKLRETFDQFVGESLFSQMIKSMRSTVSKPAYFHGGRAEEVFQSQLDQKLAEEITKASADKFSGPMFELFMARK